MRKRDGFTIFTSRNLLLLPATVVEDGFVQPFGGMSQLKGTIEAVGAIKTKGPMTSEEFSVDVMIVAESRIYINGSLLLCFTRIVGSIILRSMTEIHFYQTNHRRRSVLPGVLRDPRRNAIVSPETCLLGSATSYCRVVLVQELYCMQWKYSWSETYFR